MTLHVASEVGLVWPLILLPYRLSPAYKQQLHGLCLAFYGKSAGHAAGSCKRPDAFIHRTTLSSSASDTSDPMDLGLQAAWDKVGARSLFHPINRGGQQQGDVGMFVVVGFSILEHVRQPMLIESLAS